MKKFVTAKLHGLTVTGADLEYHGSITLDPAHCREAGIVPMEFVEIWNKQSGARISTYVIYGEEGSRCCILNGAAARTCQKGDQVIICSSEYRQTSELVDLRPVVLTFDNNNHVTEKLTYASEERSDGHYDFSILNEDGAAEKIPLKVRSA